MQRERILLVKKYAKKNAREFIYSFLDVYLLLTALNLIYFPVSQGKFFFGSKPEDALLPFVIGALYLVKITWENLSRLKNI